MANFIPKIEYGLGPTIVTFEFPPEGDYLNETIDASETTNRSFNGKVQTTWGYNSQQLNPHFKLVNHDVKNKVELFFNNWASLGNAFKYFPHSDGAQSFTVVSQTKKLTPKILAIQSHDNATQTTKFFWEFDIPMIVTDPGTTAVSGAPVTSVNTRLGDVFVREIYNQSETDIIATGTDTGLDAKLITVPDTTSLLPEQGRVAFTTNTNTFVGYDGTSWVQLSTIGPTGGDVVGPGTATDNAFAVYDGATGKLLKDSTVTTATITGMQTNITTLQTDMVTAQTDITNINTAVGNLNTLSVTTAANFTGLNRVVLTNALDKTVKESAYSIPPLDGLANQILKTDGVGVVTWVDLPQAYPLVSTQAVIAGGQITLAVAPYQIIDLTSIAPITLATEIFIIPVGFLDGSKVTIHGTDDTNKITLASSDVANGQIMFGNINLKKFTSITFIWDAAPIRFIEKCRNSQSVITAI